MMSVQHLKIGEEVLVTNCAISNRFRSGVVVAVHPQNRFAVVRVGDAYNECFFANELHPPVMRDEQTGAF